MLIKIYYQINYLFIKFMDWGELNSRRSNFLRNFFLNFMIEILFFEIIQVLDSTFLLWDFKWLISLLWLNCFESLFFILFKYWMNPFIEKGLLFCYQRSDDPNDGHNGEVLFQVWIYISCLFRYFTQIHLKYIHSSRDWILIS